MQSVPLKRGFSWLTGSLAAIVVMFAASWGVLAVQAQDAGAVPASEYRLGTGDKVKVTVFQEPDLSGDFEIDGTGVISFPLIGPVQASGLTVRGLIQDLTSKLSVYLKAPRVSIEVTNFRPFYIIGEVNKPGQYPYSEGMTILKAVAVAGGFTYRANETSVILKRGNQEMDTPISETLAILPGDTIVVRERYF